MMFTPREMHRLLTGVRNIFIKDKCWLRGNDSTIYTRVELDNGTFIQAHRMSIEYFKGVGLNPNAYGCHYCDIKACINPDHLFGGTPGMNHQDFLRKNPNRIFTIKSSKPKYTFCGSFGGGY